MKSKEQIPKPEESLDDLEIDETSSVDDFIRELEAKEKDLHITSDLRIEIEEPDFDPEKIPVLVQQELALPKAGAATAVQAASPRGTRTRVSELENEVAALKDRVVNLRAERNEIQEKSDRRLKDFQNYKYRMDRERRGSFIDQISNLASQMLPVLDNLDRALGSLENRERGKSAEFQQFYDGIALVNQQVNEILSEMGVEPIVTVGETFDPNFHEAVAVEENYKGPTNLILEEMLRGYRIGHRVIRHSMVKVTTAPSSARIDELSTSSDGENIDVSPGDSPENEPPESDTPVLEA